MCTNAFLLGRPNLVGLFFPWEPYFSIFLRAATVSLPPLLMLVFVCVLAGPHGEGAGGDGAED
jgi:hypothetical protein